MRLSWDDGLRQPIGKLDRKEAEFIYNMGFRVVGLGDSHDASDDDVKYAKNMLGEVGLTIGPFWIGQGAFRPDPDQNKADRVKLLKALDTAGRLGCSHLGFAVGSMSPKSAYHPYPDNHTQKAMDILVKSMRELVPYAEDAGVVLSPETTQWTIVNCRERMREFVDRVDSPFVRVCLDPCNHMTPLRLYESGEFITTTIDYLGDRIGSIHCKDANVADRINISDIDEARMGTGQLDHEALIKASKKLEPWKTFSLEHIYDMNLLKPAHDHIEGIAKRIGHKWDDPSLTRQKWLKANNR